MDGPTTAAATSGALGAISAIAVAWINRGHGAGIAELRKQLDILIGPDNKYGSDTEIGRLKARLVAAESAIATVVAHSAEVGALRAHIDQQLHAARTEWDSWRRSNQRRPTGSQPAIVDEEGRRRMDDLDRRIEDVELDLKKHAEGNMKVQLQMERIATLLDLLMKGNLNIGSKSR